MFVFSSHPPPVYGCQPLVCVVTSVICVVICDIYEVIHKHGHFYADTTQTVVPNSTLYEPCTTCGIQDSKGAKETGK